MITEYEDLMEIREALPDDRIVNDLIDGLLLYKGQVDELMKFIRKLNMRIDELEGNDGISE